MLGGAVDHVREIRQAVGGAELGEQRHHVALSDVLLHVRPEEPVEADAHRTVEPEGLGGGDDVEEAVVVEGEPEIVALDLHRRAGAAVEQHVRLVEADRVLVDRPDGVGDALREGTQLLVEAGAAARVDAEWRTRCRATAR